MEQDQQVEGMDFNCSIVLVLVVLGDMSDAAVVSIISLAIATEAVASIVVPAPVVFSLVVPVRAVSPLVVRVPDVVPVVVGHALGAPVVVSDSTTTYTEGSSDNETFGLSEQEVDELLQNVNSQIRYMLDSANNFEQFFGGSGPSKYGL